MPLRAQRVLSVRVRKGRLEAGNSGAAGDPIMPIGDSFSGFLVRSDRSELRRRNCHDPTMPTDQDEHLGGAGVFGRRTAHRVFGAEDLLRASVRAVVGDDERFGKTGGGVITTQRMCGA